MNKAKSDVAVVGFADLFELSEIQRLQDAFATTHHVASVITDPRGVPITRPSNFTRLCRDLIGAEPECRADLGRCGTAPGSLVQRCPTSGLWCSGARIDAGDTHLATWFVGQVRIAGDALPNATDRGCGSGRATAQFAAALAEVPMMSSERFEEICSLLHLLAELVSRQGARNALLRTVLAEKESLAADLDVLELRLHDTAGAEAVGRIAGGIAHDFGNLITAISGYAEMMTDVLDDPDDPRAPPNRILAASERAGELVRQLLDVSRQQSGAHETVDLRHVISDTASLLERTLPRTVRMVCDLPPDPVQIRGDVVALNSALLNLGINAGHAMPRGGLLQFTLSDRRLDTDRYGCRPGRYAEIRVSDTGVGMDGGTVTRIFEPYFTTRADGTGTGLGLARVRSCVERHGGGLDVSSEPGRGSVFSLWLPLEESTDQRRRAV